MCNSLFVVFDIYGGGGIIPLMNIWIDYEWLPFKNFTTVNLIYIFKRAIFVQYFLP